MSQDSFSHIIYVVRIRLQKYNFYFENKKKIRDFLLFISGFQEKTDFKGWRWRVGITNPLVLIGRTFFDGGLQIRRNAWRACVLEKRR